MSAITRVSRRMEETADLLGRAIFVTFLAACLVVIPCAVALLMSVTFAVLHQGDDLHFGGESGGDAQGGDVIVLPTQLF